MRIFISAGEPSGDIHGANLIRSLRQARPDIESSFVMPVGSALSVHGGPGTLLVGIQELDRQT